MSIGGLLKGAPLVFSGCTGRSVVVAATDEGLAGGKEGVEDGMQGRGNESAFPGCDLVGGVVAGMESGEPTSGDVDAPGASRYMHRDAESAAGDGNPDGADFA